MRPRDAFFYFLMIHTKQQISAMLNLQFPLTGAQEKNMTPLQKRLTTIVGLLFIMTSLSLPVLSQAAVRPALSETPPVPVEVILEEPTAYHPPIGPCDETFWYEIINDRGHNVYLTLNAHDPADSTNWAEWIPDLPEAGYYQVEAYITWHSSIIWCTGDEIIDFDTTDARYTITHAFGDTTVSRSQTPLANQWLDLGEYYFEAGTDGKVVLTDLNGEDEFTRTVSFSAMRFTWKRTPPEKRLLPMLNRNLLPTATVDPNPWYGIQAAPAFDACHMGGVSTMQTWWDSSPYKIVGLYLGGVAYPSDPPVDCSIITIDWVQQVRNMGWSFIPTWVGPQAPCTSYAPEKRMDEDPAVTYLQGRQEAYSASLAATSLGLTDADGGTIIYYDMEAYGGDEACRAAVASFVNGWTERLHELGNQSGVYGGSCSSYARDWVTLDNPPDNVWLAYWTEEEYDPYQTVWNLPCFSNDYYTNHQRIKQYTGGHDESWGGKQLQIDSDVADAQVAMPVFPLGGSLPTEDTQTIQAIQQVGWLDAERGWLLSDGGLFQSTDAGASWQSQGLSGIQRASVMPDGSAWAAGSGSLYRRFAGDRGWFSADLPNEFSGWRAVQLGFEDMQSGWLVLQMPTSTIFNTGKLLRTADGGSTWQSFDLPFAAPITWVGDHTGWLSGGVSGRELYRTQDAGASWAKASLPADLAKINASAFLGQVRHASDGTLSFNAAISQVKTPRLQTYTSRDQGKTWQLTGSFDLYEGAPLHTVAESASGLFADGAQLRSSLAASSFSFQAPLVQLGEAGELAWAVTRQGTCSGEKGQPSFTCRSEDHLWLSNDGGKTWRQVLP